MFEGDITPNGIGVAVLKTLCQFLADEAKCKHLTIYQLEKLTGLQGKQIKQILSGEGQFTAENLFKLMTAIEIRLKVESREGLVQNTNDLLKFILHGDEPVQGSN